MDSGLKQLQGAALEKRPLNVVLLSSQLFDTSGIELARRIKSDAQFEGIRVILMSFSDDEAMNVPRDAAIDDGLPNAGYGWLRSVSVSIGFAMNP